MVKKTAEAPDLAEQVNEAHTYEPPSQYTMFSADDLPHPDELARQFARMIPDAGGEVPRLTGFAVYHKEHGWYGSDGDCGSGVIIYPTLIEAMAGTLDGMSRDAHPDIIYVPIIAGGGAVQESTCGATDEALRHLDRAEQAAKAIAAAQSEIFGYGIQHDEGWAHTNHFIAHHETQPILIWTKRDDAVRHIAVCAADEGMKNPRVVPIPQAPARPSAATTETPQPARTITITPTDASSCDYLNDPRLLDEDKEPDTPYLTGGPHLAKALDDELSYAESGTQPSEHGLESYMSFLSQFAALTDAGLIAIHAHRAKAGHRTFIMYDEDSVHDFNQRQRQSIVDLLEDGYLRMDPDQQYKIVATDKAKAAIAEYKREIRQRREAALARA